MLRNIYKVNVIQLVFYLVLITTEENKHKMKKKIQNTTFIEPFTAVHSALWIKRGLRHHGRNGAQW